MNSRRSVRYSFSSEDSPTENSPRAASDASSPRLFTKVKFSTITEEESEYYTDRRSSDASSRRFSDDERFQRTPTKRTSRHKISLSSKLRKQTSRVLSPRSSISSASSRSSTSFSPKQNQAGGPRQKPKNAQDEKRGSSPRVLGLNNMPLCMPNAKRSPRSPCRFSDIVDLKYLQTKKEEDLPASGYYATLAMKRATLPNMPGAGLGAFDVVQEDDLPAPDPPLTPKAHWQDSQAKVSALQKTTQMFQEAGSERRGRLEILKEMMRSTHATMAWKAKKKSVAENYHSILALTQAHGQEAKQVGKVNRLYIADIQLKRTAPESWEATRNTQEAQEFVKREVKYFLRRSCPEPPAKFTFLYDPLVDERHILHVMVDFRSMAATQKALRALRQEGPVVDGDNSWSWRYCGLAWEPDEICGKGSKVARPPSFHNDVQIFNLSDVGREQLQAEHARQKPQSRFTFSCAPTSFNTLGRERCFI